LGKRSGHTGSWERWAPRNGTGLKSPATGRMPWPGTGIAMRPPATPQAARPSRTASSDPRPGPAPDRIADPWPGPAGPHPDPTCTAVAAGSDRGGVTNPWLLLLFSRTLITGKSSPSVRRTPSAANWHTRTGAAPTTSVSRYNRPQRMTNVGLLDAVTRERQRVTAMAISHRHQAT
jgi:hypothetical protein